MLRMTYAANLHDTHTKLKLLFVIMKTFLPDLLSFSKNSPHSGFEGKYFSVIIIIKLYLTRKMAVLIQVYKQEVLDYGWSAILSSQLSLESHMKKKILWSTLPRG